MTSAGARPRVLVLMATCNGASWIEPQLRSIFEQEGVDLTLVVRDDASTDATRTILARAAEGRDDMIVHAAREPSGSASRNFFALMRMVDPSGYDYVALADQDDIWDARKLARAVARLGAADAVGYSAAVRAFWPDGRTAVLAQSPEITEADYLFEGAGQGCTFVVKASFMASVQRVLAAQCALLERIHYHDWTLYALCRVQSGDWIIDEQVCMQYRQHTANDTGARGSRTATQRRLELVSSGWYGQQIEAIARLCVAVAPPGPTPAERYLALLAGSSRLALARFVMTFGRRKFRERLVLVWAALSGYLGDASRAERPPARPPPPAS